MRRARGMQLINACVKASRAYQRDCNMRLIAKPDGKRIALREKSAAAFVAMTNYLTKP
jgi:hypothetical protein